MRFTFTDNDRGNPPGKLADCEIHFDHLDSPFFGGLKLIGFAVWERRGGGGRNVTFPARQYTVNRERRSFALLRPTGAGDVSHNLALRDAILTAYDDHCATRDGLSARGVVVEDVALPGVEAVRAEDRAVPAVADVPFSLERAPMKTSGVQGSLLGGWSW
jgi:hypothetical protein